MYTDAEEKKKEFLKDNIVSDGMMFKMDFDPRIIGNKILPDGTKKTVTVVNGKGSVDWKVPDDYKPGKYRDSVKFEGNNKYLPSKGPGTVPGDLW